MKLREKYLRNRHGGHELWLAAFGRLHVDVFHRLSPISAKLTVTSKQSVPCSPATRWIDGVSIG
jgi:hypothetical protein